MRHAVAATVSSAFGNEPNGKCIMHALWRGSSTRTATASS